MFFGDPLAAFANIGRALHPSARLVLLTWQPLSANKWLREFLGALSAGRDLPAPPPDAPGPFSLSDPDRVRDVLGRAGYDAVEVDGRRAPMWFGRSAEEAYGFIRGLMGWMVTGLDEPARHRALDGLRATLVAHESGQGRHLRVGGLADHRSTGLIVAARQAVHAARRGGSSRPSRARACSTRPRSASRGGPTGRAVRVSGRPRAWQAAARASS